ncbi:hypothetical protein ACQ7HM_21160 [Williamsia sp. MIQD14]|uniref:hypothetical protein n=1 Tax=Williamsia sp. MIQD14 TaxID=3425703 RepID=UPI003DA0868C
MTTMEFADHENLHQLQALAYRLRHHDGLSWAAVAGELDEPVPVVQDLVADYITRTDAAADATQPALF